MTIAHVSYKWNKTKPCRNIILRINIKLIMNNIETLSIVMQATYKLNFVMIIIYIYHDKQYHAIYIY